MSTENSTSTEDPKTTEDKTQTPTPNAPTGITKQQVEEMLAQVREEERKRFEQTNTEREQELAAAKQVGEQLKTEIEGLKKELEGKLDLKQLLGEQEPDPIKPEEEVVSLREEIERLKQEVVDATRQSKEEALAALTEHKEALAQEKLDIYILGLRSKTELGEMVYGNSREEVDRNFQIAKEKEEAYKKKIEEQTRKELISSLPSPLRPGVGGELNNANKSYASRRANAKKNKNDFRRAQDQRLAELRKR